MAVAVAGGLVLAGTTAIVGLDWTLPAHLLFALVTLVLVVTDLDHKLIPNRILYPGSVAAVALLALGAAAESRLEDLLVGLVTGAAWFLVLLLVAIVARGGFGLGDVKLAFLLGVFTGFAGVRVFLLSVFLTGLYGGIPAIVILVTRRGGTRDDMPYGPAMVLGAWTALAVGDAILRWYTG
jgi:leader peptidase (prepilin peptidase)/N-methyltransferase